MGSKLPKSIQFMELPLPNVGDALLNNRIDAGWLVEPFQTVLTESGKVWFAEPNRFRWELGHPPKTIAVRATDEMLLLYPLLKRAERYPLNLGESDIFSMMMCIFPPCTIFARFQHFAQACHRRRRTPTL